MGKETGSIHLMASAETVVMGIWAGNLCHHCLPVGPGQKQTLNPKIRTQTSPRLALLLQPNAKTKTLHKLLDHCLLVVPRQLAISPLPIASTTSDRNGSCEGNSWKVRQGESLSLFYITDVSYVLAIDRSQWKMKQIMIWGSKTKWVYAEPHLR